MQNRGWKPLPLALKIIFVVFVIWIIGAVSGIPARYESGIPFFGFFVRGATAVVIVSLLDILAPAVFLGAMVLRKAWAPFFALAFIAIFVLNGVAAFFTVREQLGIMPILIPTLVEAVFAAVIVWKRNYFKSDA